MEINLLITENENFMKKFVKKLLIKKIILHLH